MVLVSSTGSLFLYNAYGKSTVIDNYTPKSQALLNDKVVKISDSYVSIGENTYTILKRLYIPTEDKYLYADADNGLFDVDGDSLISIQNSYVYNKIGRHLEKVSFQPAQGILNLDNYYYDNNSKLWRNVVGNDDVGYDDQSNIKAKDFLKFEKAEETINKYISIHSCAYDSYYTWSIMLSLLLIIFSFFVLFFI